MNNNLKNEVDKLRVQAEINNLKLKATVEKLKAEMAIHKLEGQLKDKTDQFKANVSDLKENAEAFVNNAKNANQTPTQESWLNTIKTDLADGWKEIEDTAKDAWSQMEANQKK